MILGVGEILILGVTLGDTDTDILGVTDTLGVTVTLGVIEILGVGEVDGVGSGAPPHQRFESTTPVVVFHEPVLPI